jgi:hypothetical protein
MSDVRLIMRVAGPRGDRAERKTRTDAAGKSLS